METQTWLSCHYKSISAENITILSVLSNDYMLTRSCRTANVELQFVCEQKIKSPGEGRWCQNIRCYKHQEIGVGLLRRSNHTNLCTCRSMWDFLNNLRSQNE